MYNSDCVTQTLTAKYTLLPIHERIAPQTITSVAARTRKYATLTNDGDVNGEYNQRSRHLVKQWIAVYDQYADDRSHLTRSVHFNEDNRQQQQRRLRRMREKKHTPQYLIRAHTELTGYRCSPCIQLSEATSEASASTPCLVFQMDGRCSGQSNMNKRLGE